MASKKSAKPVKITTVNNGMVEMILDEAEFNKLIGRLTTIINFANGATEALCNLKAQLATVYIHR